VRAGSPYPLVERRKVGSNTAEITAGGAGGLPGDLGHCVRSTHTVGQRPGGQYCPGYGRATCALRSHHGNGYGCDAAPQAREIGDWSLILSIIAIAVDG
jgi:hypothetical protein